MRAFQLIAQGNPGTFKLNDVPEPVAGADEVVVRVKACGLNHLDLWLEEAGLPMAVPLPRTPGCEISGVIESVGSGAGDWEAGDRVAIQSNLFCGTCEFCLEGEESVCLNGQLLGVQVDGGFAEFVKVPARALVSLPDELGLEGSAALSLAASTAMHMLTHRTEVKKGMWVLVVGGASGVGSAAIQIAKHLGARVISTGSTPEKREFAKSLGAEFVVDAAEADWTAQIRKYTNKRGVDIIVEHVGGPILEALLNVLARNGTVVTCGATAGRDIKVNLWPLFVKQQRLIGSYGRNRADIRRTLEWAADGILKPCIDRVFPLAEAQTAFTLLRERKMLGKFVIVP